MSAQVARKVGKYTNEQKYLVFEVQKANLWNQRKLFFDLAFSSNFECWPFRLILSLKKDNLNIQITSIPLHSIKKFSYDIKEAKWKDSQSCFSVSRTEKEYIPKNTVTSYKLSILLQKINNEFMILFDTFLTKEWHPKLQLKRK